MRIELCCHLITQTDTLLFHTQVVKNYYPSLWSSMLDRYSQERVKTKVDSSFNYQSTFVEWCNLWIMKKLYFPLNGPGPLPSVQGSRLGVSYPYPVAFIMCMHMGGAVVCII